MPLPPVERPQTSASSAKRHIGRASPSSLYGSRVTTPRSLLASSASIVPSPAAALLLQPPTLPPSLSGPSLSMMAFQREPKVNIQPWMLIEKREAIIDKLRSFAVEWQRCFPESKPPPSARSSTTHPFSASFAARTQRTQPAALGAAALPPQTPSRPMTSPSPPAVSPSSARQSPRRQVPAQVAQLYEAPVLPSSRGMRQESASSPRAPAELPPHQHRHKHSVAAEGFGWVAATASEIGVNVAGAQQLVARLLTELMLCTAALIEVIDPVADRSRARPRLPPAVEPPADGPGFSAKWVEWALHPPPSDSHLLPPRGINGVNYLLQVSALDEYYP